MEFLVGLDAVAQPGGEPLARHVLAALGDTGRDTGDIGAPRQRLAVHGRYVEGPGCAERLAYAGLLPAPEVRREDREVVAGGGCDAARRERRDHGVVHVQRTPLGGQGVAQPLLAVQRVPADPGGDVHLAGAALVDDAAHLLDEFARTDDQPAAPLAQPGVQRGEAVGEEGPPVGRVEPGAPDALVPDEQRDHPVGGPERGPQHGLVVDAQVGGEENHGNGHGPHPAGAGPEVTAAHARQQLGPRCDGELERARHVRDISRILTASGESRYVRPRVFEKEYEGTRTRCRESVPPAHSFGGVREGGPR